MTVVFKVYVGGVLVKEVEYPASTPPILFVLAIEQEQREYVDQEVRVDIEFAEAA